jgi:hypothetical protein
MATIVASAQDIRPISSVVTEDPSWFLVPQGDDSLKIRKELEQTIRHLLECVSQTMPESGEEDEFSYVGAPPKRAYYVNVRYEFLGKGSPIPFDWEEED